MFLSTDIGAISVAFVSVYHFFAPSSLLHYFYISNSMTAPLILNLQTKCSSMMATWQFSRSQYVDHLPLIWTNIEILHHYSCFSP